MTLKDVVFLIAGVAILLIALRAIMSSNDQQAEDLGPRPGPPPDNEIKDKK
jgi:hypothetical protein